MKTKLSIWVAALGLIVASAGASATVLSDTYHGGNGHGYGDVVSSPGDSRFNIDGMEGKLNGNQLTVIIYTNFAGKAGVMPSLTRNNTGIGYGDLLISTGWAPHGSSPYATDNAANGNHWTYAFSLDDPLNNAGGNGTVYALGAGNAGNHNPDVLLSNDFMDCSNNRCIYRDGQAVAVNTSSATAMANTGTWTVGDGFLSFSFDTAGLDLDPASFGFHWTMYCGNDVIEGLDPVTVPEPSPAGIFLLGIGLVGLGVMRRRKSARGL